MKRPLPIASHIFVDSRGIVRPGQLGNELTVAMRTSGSLGSQHFSFSKSFKILFCRQCLML